MEPTILDLSVYLLVVQKETSKQHEWNDQWRAKAKGNLKIRLLSDRAENIKRQIAVLLAEKEKCKI